MFQFPGFAPYGLCIHPQVTPSGCPVTPGFPIRRSPDQSLFDSSPRHIAACHVLHRLSTPRHPPCTLSSLTTLMRDCLGQASFRHSRFLGVIADRPAPNRRQAPALTSRNLWFSSTIPWSADRRRRRNKSSIAPSDGPASASSIVKEHLLYAPGRTLGSTAAPSTIS